MTTGTTTGTTMDLRAPGRPFNRVFGIGLSRTGTTTLHGAFEALGLRSVHYPSPEAMVARDFGVLDDLDAATDISVSAVFPELDERYPGSKFILTVRALEPWLASVEGHFAVRDQRKYQGASAAGLIREMTYGRRDFDRASFAITHATHTLDIKQYFRDRPGDLLVMDITAGQGWDVLCPFLGVPVPRAEFPHLHKKSVPTIEPKPAPAMAT